MAIALSSCTEETQFSGWRQESVDKTQITESTTRTFELGNPSTDGEQHIRAIAFDRGSNSAGHFRLEQLKVGDLAVEANDIVIPPGSTLKVTVTYAPKNLETTKASYGGWVTGEDKRWIPRSQEEIDNEVSDDTVIHRAIIEAVYDHPKEGMVFVELVGQAEAGPQGEEEAGAGSGKCEPGNGTMCYSGGFALDIPALAPGGPKALELTGDIRMKLSGGEVSTLMDDFPLALMYLRSEEIPQLPTGVTATLVISGAEGVEAKGTFDGSRLDLKGVAFRIRVTLGELKPEEITQGVSALIDFNVPDLVIATTKPYSQGTITLRMETALPSNPSGNELFDQFLSGAQIIAIMEGELAF
jgi:hypothetical protein